jgi:hypothetical protein
MVVDAKPSAVYVLTAFFGLQMVLASGSFALGRAWLTYQPPYWRTLLIYGWGAGYIGYLCWRQSPRARFSAYIFLTADMSRGVRGSHWATVVIDLMVLSVMQLPALRAIYPALRPWERYSRRGASPASPARGRLGPPGGEQPSNDRGPPMPT